MKLIIWLSVFMLGLTAAYAQQTFPVQSKHRISQELIDIQVTGMDGQDVPLSTIVRPDKNYVISIMASWCGPCRTELDAFQKVKDSWQKELNTEVIAISIEKPSDTHKLFELVKKQNWTMHVVHDKMAYTSRELEVFDIPHTYLVNQSGQIVYHTEGFSANLINQYRAEIEKL